LSLTVFTQRNFVADFLQAATYDVQIMVIGKRVWTSY